LWTLVASGGLTAETLRDFEREINKKLKTGRRPIAVVAIPMTRDKLLCAVCEGRVEMAVGNITITKEREALVAFSVPVYKSREVVFSGPGAPTLTSLDDLSGREVAVKRGSGYYDSLLALNVGLKKSASRRSCSKSCRKTCRRKTSWTW
jgi:ABC-type amino acid transport substrate-binding protein